MGDEDGKTGDEQGGEQQQVGDELAKKRRAKKPKGDDAGGGEPKKKRGRVKQLQIEGTERHDKIAEIEAAAEDYAATRDERMQLGKLEVEKREKLRGLMQKHQLRVYEVDGEPLRVELVPAGDDKVKVKIRGGDDEGAGSDDDPAGN